MIFVILLQDYHKLQNYLLKYFGDTSPDMKIFGLFLYYMKKQMVLIIKAK